MAVSLRKIRRLLSRLAGSITKAAPAAVSWGKAWRFLSLLGRRTATQFGDDRCIHMAAAIAYYVLVSFFPLLLFLIATFSLFVDVEEVKRQVIDSALRVVPLTEEGGEELIAGVIDDVLRARGAITGIALLLTAWSAGSMFAALRSSLNVAWGVQRPRPIVQQKLIDLGMVLAVGGLFLLSLGSTMVLQVARRLAEALGPLSAATGLLWEAAFYLLPAIFSFVTFTLVYRFVPNTSVRWREAFAGAAVAAVLFELGKNGFAVYVSNFGNYGATYGALGAVVAFLFWTYLSALFVLLGAEVASEVPRTLAELARPAAPAAEARPRAWRQELWRAVKGLFVAGESGREAPSGGGDDEPKNA